MKLFRIANIEKILEETNDAVEVLGTKEETLNRNISESWKKIMHQNEVNALKSRAYDQINKLLMED